MACVLVYMRRFVLLFAIFPSNFHFISVYLQKWNFSICSLIRDRQMLYTTHSQSYEWKSSFHSLSLPLSLPFSLTCICWLHTLEMYTKIAVCIGSKLNRAKRWRHKVAHHENKNSLERTKYVVLVANWRWFRVQNISVSVKYVRQTAAAAQTHIHTEQKWLLTKFYRKQSPLYGISVPFVHPFAQQPRKCCNIAYYRMVDDLFSTFLVANPTKIHYSICCLCVCALLQSYDIHVLFAVE